MRWYAAACRARCKKQVKPEGAWCNDYYFEEAGDGTPRRSRGGRSGCWTTTPSRRATLTNLVQAIEATWPHFRSSSGGRVTQITRCSPRDPGAAAGVAGPVGTGKSSLIALLCAELGRELSLAVITNDIYTDEDARFLRSAGVLAPERIRAVETGACPHTAIRDDVTQNLLAVEDLERDFAPVDVVLVESGGDNLTATFSPALVDAQFFVLDVAGGGDVARKGGPGIARADVLIVNKTDLAPYVGVDVEQMVRDAEQARDGRTVIALSRNDPASVDRLTQWVRDTLAEFRAGTACRRDPGPMAPHAHADGPSQTAPSMPTE